MFSLISQKKQGKNNEKFLYCFSALAHDTTMSKPLSVACLSAATPTFPALAVMLQCQPRELQNGTSVV